MHPVVVPGPQLLGHLGVHLVQLGEEVDAPLGGGEPAVRPAGDHAVRDLLVQRPLAGGRVPVAVDRREARPVDGAARHGEPGAELHQETGGGRPAVPLAQLGAATVAAGEHPGHERPLDRRGDQPGEPVRCQLDAIVHDQRAGAAEGLGGHTSTVASADRPRRCPVPSRPAPESTGSTGRLVPAC